RPKAQVEEGIFERLTTKEEPKPAFGSAYGPSSSSALPGNSLGAPAAGTGSSFLDEWLAKRRTPSTPASTPLGSSAPRQPSATPSRPDARNFGSSPFGTNA